MHCPLRFNLEHSNCLEENCAWYQPQCCVVFNLVGIDENLEEIARLLSLKIEGEH